MFDTRNCIVDTFTVGKFTVGHGLLNESLHSFFNFVVVSVLNFSPFVVSSFKRIFHCKERKKKEREKDTLSLAVFPYSDIFYFFGYCDWTMTFPVHLLCVTWRESGL